MFQEIKDIIFKS